MGNRSVDSNRQRFTNAAGYRVSRAIRFTVPELALLMPTELIGALLSTDRTPADCYDYRPWEIKRERSNG